MIKKQIDVAIFHQEKNGEMQSGDSFFYIEKDDMFVCALADGLGNGELAKESSEIVIDLIKNNLHLNEEEIILSCNKHLRDKRGVVLGILKIDITNQSYTYSSIGNIRLLIITKANKMHRSIPKNGYLANCYRELKVTQGNIERDTNLILYSDGVEESELISCCCLNIDVHELIDEFKRVKNEERKDDTTLIAIRYLGEG